MFFSNLIIKVFIVHLVVIDAYNIVPITTDRTTKYSGINLPKYTIEWTDADIDTEEKKVEIYEKWLSQTVDSIGENASVEEIRKEIACYPGPPLSSQTIAKIDGGMIPCNIFEDYINKTMTEGKELAQLLRLNKTQIVWNDSIAENVLNMKSRLQSVQESFPQITDVDASTNIRDLNYQFSLLSSEIPAEQYNSLNSKTLEARVHNFGNMTIGRFNQTDLVSFLNSTISKSQNYSDFSSEKLGNISGSFWKMFDRNFTDKIGSGSSSAPKNLSWVVPVLKENGLIPESLANNLGEISKRFRNFSMPAKLDPYYDKMVELAEQNRTTELKALAQDVLQIPQKATNVQTLLDLFKGRVTTATPSQQSSAISTEKQTLSESLSSKIPDVLRFDQMKNLKEKLVNGLSSLNQ